MTERTRLRWAKRVLNQRINVAIFFLNDILASAMWPSTPPRHPVAGVSSSKTKNKHYSRDSYMMLFCIISISPNITKCSADTDETPHVGSTLFENVSFLALFRQVRTLKFRPATPLYACNSYMMSFCTFSII